MLCTRCGGLLVIDDIMDLWEESSQMRSQAYRCVNCGCVEDPTIRANRQRALAATCLAPHDPGRNGRMGSVELISSAEDVDERRYYASEYDN
jgi:hypothetical protein